MIRNLMIAILAIVAAMLGGVPCARATGLGSDQAQWGNWEFSFAPYLWYIFLDSDISARGQTVSVDANLYEILNEQDNIVAWYSYQEARNGPLTLYADVQYINLEFGGDLVTAKTVTPRLSIDARVNVGLGLEMAIIESGAKFELFRQTHGPAPRDPADFAPYTALDLIAGTRVWWLETDIGLAVDANAVLNLPALGLTRSRERNLVVAKSGSVSWVDPLVGAQLSHHLSPGSEIVVRGDVGGFDVGSDFSWQALAYYQWECGCKPFGTTMSAILGYRALDVDYSAVSRHGPRGFQLLQHGPIAYTRFSF